MTIAHNLASRGIQVAHGFVTKRQSDEQPEVPKIPAAGALVFVLTVVLSFLALAALSYTYGHLITTLCMVDNSSQTAYVPIESVEPVDDEPPAYSEDGTPKPVDNLVKTQPITASLRDTVEHLRAKGGRWSIYRGLSVYIAWNFARGIVVGILTSLPGSFFHSIMWAILASIIAEIALVRQRQSYQKDSC